jgi:rubrerythrin
MNIYEFAMKMEKDGQAFYEKMAAQSENKVLKQILTNLAQDEVKHYNLFKKFRDGDSSAAADLKGSATQVMKNAQNVFEQLNAAKIPVKFSDDIVASWKEAQTIEKKSEDFYREKAAEEKNAEVKKTIVKIADEEHKHWVLIENVLHFLERPKQWVENAEWNNMEPY